MDRILFLSRAQEKEKKLTQALGKNYNLLRDTSLIFLKAVDLVIIDFTSLEREGEKWLLKIAQENPGLTILGWIDPKLQKDLRENLFEKGVYEYITDEFDFPTLRRIIHHGIERTKLLKRIENMEKSFLSPFPHPDTPSPMNFVSLISRYHQALKDFSQVLASGYKLEEVLESFLFLISRMLSIPRVCLILWEEREECYKIKSCLGIPPSVKEKIAFLPASPLPLSLKENGVIIDRKKIKDDLYLSRYPKLEEEMELLQAQIALPIMHKGELIGVVTLGNRITGESLTPEEIELLYSLASQLGAILENLFLYHRLSYSSKFMENLLENVASGVISIDTRETISIFNSRAEEILGIKAKKVRGKDLRKLPAILADLLYETLRTGKKYERKEIEVSPEKRPLGVSTTRLQDEEGNILGSVMIFTDLSPIKKLEEERKKLERLQFASKVAMRLSHEFKNSLVSINTFIQLFPEKYQEEEFRKKYYRVVRDEVKRLDELVEKLLFFTQPFSLNPTPESLKNILNLTLRQLKKEGLPTERVEKECEDSLNIEGDREYLIYALSNLLRNGLEALGERGKVKIICSNCSWSPEFICIEVKDEGKGMEEEERNQALEPFYTTKTRGLGLGLNIAQRIVEAHGGKLEIISTKGKGTSVILYLPKKHLAKGGEKG